MYSHFALYPFTFFIILHYLFFNLPLSFGADDFRYTNCSQPFNCGNIRNIRFPFWGNNRPDYCGQPGYELRCEDDDRLELVNVTPRYQVLNFSYVDQRPHIVPVDASTDSCPAPSVNVSFPAGNSTYSLPNSDNIILFYDCPTIPSLASYTYPCSPNDNTSSRNYFWIDPTSTEIPPAEAAAVWECNDIVSVPILQTLADNVVNNTSRSLQQVLWEGFEFDFLESFYEMELDTNSTFCRRCHNSGGSCGYSWTTYQPRCYCDDNEYEWSCPVRPAHLPSSVSVPTGLIIGIIVVVGCAVGVALFWKRLCSSISIIFWKRQNKSQRLVEDFLQNYGSLLPKRYSYYDLKKITSSFKDKIGQGGYGEVYKGTLLDGRLVAVKLLNNGKGTGGQEFINEVSSISKTSHVNVVNLLGFCFDRSKRALIYEFMANGSLEKFIFGRNPLETQAHLGWETFYRVAIGVARGLEYLHRGCNTRILHFDIKPHNILLDVDFTPKISDFGLAKLCPRNDSIISMLDARGTVGYIAPEVFSRQFGGVSHKSDVYSYGMMVLAVIGGKKNVDVQVSLTSEIYFPEWIYERLEQGEDLGLNGIMSADEGVIARKMMLVALWCIQTNPKDRPTMTRVVEMLEGTHESLLLPPKPYLCSPPRSPRSSLSSSTT